MARRSGTKNELIKCEYCGELYSVTYKHCPFCNEDGTGSWNDPATLEQEEYYDDPPRRGGGKRLAGGGGGEGPSLVGILKAIASLALIIAAVCIVISIVKPLLGKGEAPDPDTSVSPENTAAVEDTTSPDGQGDGVEETEPPLDSVPPETSPSVTPITPAITAPTAFTLSRDDFTFDQAGQIYQIKVTYTPADARGDITWKSSDPNVASVSWDGTVTAVSKGTVTVTATVAGVGEQTCIVRCNFAEDTPATSAPTTTPDNSASASGLSLNREDFTLSHAGETWRLIVSGTSAAVTWQSSNTSVATVGADGTVTAVGKGTCTVTATVNGVSLKCIVRCNF